MKEGGKASTDKMRLPKIPGRIKRRTDGAMKRRAEEESMKELRYPTKKPTRKRPDRPKVTPRPMPMPRPRPKNGPDFRPMPMPRPKRKLPKEIEKFLMDMPRMRPALKKDGGTMKSMADLFGKAATAGLGGLPGSAFKRAFEKAKKLKPSGRLNVDDIKKAIDSMKKAKKIDMSPGRRKAETGSATGKTRGEKLAESLKNRPPMKKPKAVRRQMAKKASKRLI